jgi:hypothetical protein
VSPERNQYRISFEDLAAHAKEITIQDGHHVAVLIVEGSRRLAVSHIQEMPETHGERLQLMQLFGQAAAESGKFGRLEQIFFVSEGWMSVSVKEKPPSARPSQDPDRREVLIISGLELKGRSKQLKIFEMVRDQEERVVDLAELSPPTDASGTIEIPLLDAFALGFRLAFQAQLS